ncbi:ENV1 protein, partial [Xiphorhynchus elegans]|nr:ENV1 protein [Xiphorhynchus elegans]
LAKVKEGIEKRKREREAQHRGWFDQFPWLTTLISTIAGPIVIILLILSFGPCIFNKVVDVIKSRLEAVHLMTFKETDIDANKHLLKEDPNIQAAREAITK